LNEGNEALDRIESGNSDPILGATAPKALAPVAVLVRRSRMKLRDADRTALPGT